MIHDLSFEQKTVVDNNVFPAYCISGAGTGKTYTLLHTVVKLIENGVRLHEIGVITFTNKAAFELKKRIYDILCEKSANNNELRQEIETLGSAPISTIHSFCGDIIEEYGMAKGFPIDFEIRSFKGKAYGIINDTIVQNHDNFCLAYISTAKLRKLIYDMILLCTERGYNISRGIINDLYPAKSSFWNDFKNALLNLYVDCNSAIDREKKRLGIISTSDIIKYAVQLLEIEHIAKRVASDYHYIVADEFQDTNKYQFELMQILMRYGVKVIVVGDSKQSIYGFRGADISNSAYMENEISEKTNGNGILSLTENYRTDEKLLIKINKVFNTPFFYRNAQLSFPQSELTVPFHKSGSGADNCFEEIYGRDITEIVGNALKTEIKGRKARYEDVAILCRQNNNARQVAAKLKSAGFPVEVIGATSLFGTKEVIDTFKILSSMFNNESANYNELFFTDYYKAFIASGSSKEFNDFLHEFKSVLYTSPIGAALSFLYIKTAIMKYYREKSDYQASSNLMKLMEFLDNESEKDLRNSYQMMEYLHKMILNNWREDEADISGFDFSKGVIRIYTVHRAKGLSIPIVILPFTDSNLNWSEMNSDFLINAENGFKISFNSERIRKDLPQDTEYLSMQHKKTILDLEEELRIFYVACTRAEHKLILSAQYSKSFTQRAMGWDNYISVSKWVEQCGG